MMKHFMMLCLILFSGALFAQGVPQGISYQGLLRNSGGSLLASQNVNLRFTILQGTVNGTAEWQETQFTNTNAQGLFVVVIGQGLNTGAGTQASFSDVSWGNGAHFIRVEVDVTGGSSFVAIDTLEFFSVPYALYANKAAALIQPLSMNDLSDVDTSGILPGQVLKWNGSMWVPAFEIVSDTVLFAYQSQSAQHADTADVATHLINVPDTVLFSHHADSSLFAIHALHADSALHTAYSDTADFAWNCGNVQPSWLLAGNSGTNATTHFLGTTDATDLVFRTNNSERMRLTSTGRIGIGTSIPAADLHMVSNAGFLSEGTFASGASLPVTGAGTRLMWYPNKAAFRAGTVSANEWDLSNIGNNSFAGGFNNIAKGDNSFASGQQNQALGTNSAAIGWGNIASGYNSFAVGSGGQASGPYAIALGRGAISNDSMSICIGYHCNSTGIASLAFGYQTTASGDYSLSMGYNSSTAGKRGSFVFADASSAAVTANTADNQFMVRASGGYVFYTNTALTSGVSLAAGGGSWSTLSDRRMKTNIRKVNYNTILQGVKSVPVYTWSYKTQDSSIVHVGPMAQDFSAAFHVGESDSTISSVDADGINFAAIKALEEKTATLKQKEKEIDELELRVKAAEEKNKALELRLKKLEEALLKEEQ
jgi:hypothetical protein